MIYLKIPLPLITNNSSKKRTPSSKEEVLYTDFPKKLHKGEKGQGKKSSKTRGSMRQTNIYPPAP
jgi:hypothetical protein